MVCQVCNMTADWAVHSGCGNGGQSNDGYNISVMARICEKRIYMMVCQVCNRAFNLAVYSGCGSA